MVTYYIVISILGLLFGSFAGATVWRLRAYQLLADKKAHEQVSRAEFKQLRPLTQRSLTEDRSQCLHCKHTLAWYDLLPIVSWASTLGRCRYCNIKIGWFEPLIEIGTAILFVGVVMMLQHGSMFVVDPGIFLWLPVVVMLVILFAYDAKWFLLPDLVIIPLIIVSAITAILEVFSKSEVAANLLNVVGSVAVLGGLYGMLYYYSRFRYGEEGTWVGFGDVKLGVALGLLLGDLQLAFIALFLANFVGVLVVLPSLLMKRLTMRTHIPFGPLLIIGFFLALFFGSSIIDWYGSFGILVSSLG